MSREAAALAHGRARQPGEDLRTRRPGSHDLARNRRVRLPRDRSPAGVGRRALRRRQADRAAAPKLPARFRSACFPRRLMTTRDQIELLRRDNLVSASAIEQGRTLARARRSSRRASRRSRRPISIASEKPANTPAAARPEPTLGRDRIGSLAESRLCTRVMRAVANSGVHRLSEGWKRSRR